MGYVSLIEESKERLHLSRQPGIVAYAILIGLVSCGFGAAYYGSECLLWKVVYICGAFLVGICCLDDWEDCVFDLKSGQVEICKLNLVQKLLNPKEEQRTVTTDLSGIVDVRVEEETVKYFNKGHQVVLCLDTGLTLGVTDVCTFGNVEEHYAIAEKILKFLGLERKKMEAEDDYLGDSSSSEDSFEQLDRDSVIQEIKNIDVDLQNIDESIKNIDHPKTE